MQKYNDAIKTSALSSLEKYTSHFIERVVCERQLETEQRLQHIDPPTLLAITAFLSGSPWLLNRGPGGPVSLLRAGSHSSIFTPTDQNFLSAGLYNNLTSTLLPASVTISHSIKPLDSQGRSWSSDIFDWMHLLFTQVHFFFWQIGLVGGQYATIFVINFIKYSYQIRMNCS